MGIRIPTDPPEIIDDKFYRVTMQRFVDLTGNQNCDGPPLSDITCCITGTALNFWIDNAGDCKPSFGLCVSLFIHEERLIEYVGPFQTNTCGA